MSDPVTRAVLSDASLLAARQHHFTRLKRLYAGEQLDPPFVLNGVRGVGRCDPYCEPERWVSEALVDLAAQADRVRDEALFHPLVLEFGLYGVHFVDRMFGADVFDLDGSENWQVRVLPTGVGTLTPPDLDRDPTWELARRVALAFLEADVSVPLFGLPTIASSLNIAVNLYGQEILLAMITDPEAARHDLEVINELLCALHRWYRAHIPEAQLQPVVADQRTQPPGYGQLCSCTSHLISGATYREFIAQLDDTLLSVYPHGGMIHLCGAHTQHIPVWREMRSLRAVQLNDRAAVDLEGYFEGLREDQVIYANPCEDMPVSRIMEITRGHRTVIVADIDPSELMKPSKELYASQV